MNRRVTCRRVRLIEQVDSGRRDSTRRDQWLQGYGEQGGQKRDEKKKAVVPQARTKECGRKDITETSTD